MNKMKLIGPFSQLLTMNHLPTNGPLSDQKLEIITEAGILINNGIIESTGSFKELKNLTSTVEELNGRYTVIPGLIDAHTHICWAGSRAKDYAMRLAGENYTDISKKGGGIWSTVTQTREASLEQLTKITSDHANNLLLQGITTIEVKSGYGLNVINELKMLQAIYDANKIIESDLVSTCLAAHIKPNDFCGTEREYLEYLIAELLPVIKQKKLTSRIDIYIDKGAFSSNDAFFYLSNAKKHHFDLAVHAEQFVSGGLEIAIKLEALSADHLEVINSDGIKKLADSKTLPVILPGSSIGLGVPFAPARSILDAGCSLVIASDWNPGSAPMGNLVCQASLLGIYEKLTMAEILAALTYRAAPALRLNDRGILKSGMMADFIAYPCNDYREIIYNQGAMKPSHVWKKGREIRIQSSNLLY